MDQIFDEDDPERAVVKTWEARYRLKFSCNRSVLMPPMIEV